MPGSVLESVSRCLLSLTQAFCKTDMKITLIILNLLAAMLVFPAMALVHQAKIASASSMYTELDRAGIIDRKVLERKYPDEFKNDRYLIAQRYVGPRHSAWMLGYPCIFGFIMNAILIGLFMEKKSKTAESGRPD